MVYHDRKIKSHSVIPRDQNETGQAVSFEEEEQRNDPQFSTAAARLPAETEGMKLIPTMARWSRG